MPITPRTCLANFRIFRLLTFVNLVISQKR